MPRGLRSCWVRAAQRTAEPGPAWDGGAGATLPAAPAVPGTQGTAAAPLPRPRTRRSIPSRFAVCSAPAAPSPPPRGFRRSERRGRGAGGGRQRWLRGTAARRVPAGGPACGAAPRSVPAVPGPPRGAPGPRSGSARGNPAAAAPRPDPARPDPIGAVPAPHLPPAAGPARGRLRRPPVTAPRAARPPPAPLPK